MGGLLHQAGENLACLTMAETVREYGYDSLESAEQAYRKSSQLFS